MRARTLPQPLATLVAMGAKTLDSCPWPTSYRGRLAIHAAGKLTSLGREWALHPGIHKVLAEVGLGDPEALPLGAIVGVVDVLEARRIGFREMTEIGAWERQLGTYRPGIWMLRFGGARLAPTPIPAAGQAGLWQWHPPLDLASWWESIA